MVVKVADGFKLLDFVLGREAVAALALDARHAVLEHAVQPGQIGGDELVEGGVADGAASAADAAAGLHDLEVGFAGDAADELAAAVADEGDVGVRVDQAGDEAAAVRGERDGAFVERGLAGGAEPGDAAVADEQGRVGDQASRLASAARAQVPAAQPPASRSA